MKNEANNPERAQRATRPGIQRRAAANSDLARRMKNEDTNPERVKRAAQRGIPDMQQENRSKPGIPEQRSEEQ
jgi:hypothetical protein